MRILGPIVLTQALLMVAGKPEMPEGSAVRAQLVGRHLFRREALFAEQLAYEPDSCALVSSALNQDLQDLALMIDRAPQVHMLAGGIVNLTNSARLLPPCAPGQQARLAFPDPEPRATDSRSVPRRFKLTMPRAGRITQSPHRRGRGAIAARLA